MKKDSVFSNLFNKFIKKDNNKSNKNVNVGLHDVSQKGNNSQMTGNNNDFDNSSNARDSNNSSGASKSLEIIKQKKRDRMSLIDVNSNMSKKK